jgi:uncharacterized membrane-anchored protein YitT (DUF2179 family)
MYRLFVIFSVYLLLYSYVPENVFASILFYFLYGLLMCYLFPKQHANKQTHLGRT